jgi:hypothetical protein
MITFERLNPFIQAQVVVSVNGLLVEEDETNIPWKNLHGHWLLKNCFSLEVAIPAPMCANPFAWLKTHEGQFLNVGVFVKQVFGILRFQIEIERVLNLMGVLTTLRCCHLQVRNLNWIIIIINNWRDDSHLNCTFYLDLKDYLKVKINLANELIKKLSTSRSYKLMKIN